MGHCGWLTAAGFGNATTSGPRPRRCPSIGLSKERWDIHAIRARDEDLTPRPRALGDHGRAGRNVIFLSAGAGVPEIIAEIERRWRGSSDPSATPLDTITPASGSPSSSPRRSTLRSQVVQKSATRAPRAPTPTTFRLIKSTDPGRRVRLARVRRHRSRRRGQRSSDVILFPRIVGALTSRLLFSRHLRDRPERRAGWRVSRPRDSFHHPRRGGGACKASHSAASPSVCGRSSPGARLCRGNGVAWLTRFTAPSYADADPGSIPAAPSAASCFGAGREASTPAHVDGCASRGAPLC